MEIKIGETGYVIMTDPLNVWIEEKYINAKGKPDTRRVSGYGKKYADVLVSFCEQNTLTGDAKTVKEALKELAEQEEKVRVLVKALCEKNGLTKYKRK